MATSQHVEIEAAKFLQKLIHESKDEPAKLATKLHVICQHMKASGKEHSLPYQVISRAMETVVNQHGLDIKAVKAARLPTTGGPQIAEDSGNASRSMDKDAPDIMTPTGGSNMPFRGVPVGGAWNAGGSSSKIKEEVYGGSSMLSVGAFGDSKPGLADNEVINPNKPPVGPSRVGSAGHDFFQGPLSHRSGSLYDHESPSSLDTRSGNSQERVDTVKLDKQGRTKEPKKAATKRKRAGSTSTDVNPDNPQKLDTPSAGAKSRKGKGDTNSHFAGKSGEHAQLNPGQDCGPMEHLSSASNGMESLLRAKQESQISNVNLSEGDGSAYGAVGQQKEGFLQGRNDPFGSRNVWDQFKTGLSPDNSQLSRFAPTGAACDLTADTAVAQSAVPFLGSSKEGGASLGMSAISGGYSKVQVGMPGNFGSYATMKAGFPASVQLNNTSFNNYEIAFKLLKERGVEPELAAKMLKERGMEPYGSPFLGKGKDMASMDTAIKSSSVEPSSSRGAIDSEHRKSALMNDSESNICEKVLEAQFDQGSGSQGPQSKDNIDTGKALTARPPVPGMPFKEHHLKQLRAQCLVFLAFRNGLMPRKLHLDIALEEPNPREGGGSDGTRDELSEHKGKEISVKEPSSGSEATGVLGRPTDMSETTLPGASSIGIPKETESTSKYTDNFQKVNKGPPTDSSAATEERSHLLSARRNPETEMNIQEESDSQATLVTTSATVSVMNTGRSLPKINPDRDDIGNGQQQIGRLNPLSSSILGMNQQLKREMASLTGTHNQNEVSINALSPSTFHHSPIPQRTDYPSNHPQLLGDRERGNNMPRSEPSNVPANLHADRYPSTFTGKEASKTNSGKDVEHSRDASITRTHGSQGENHVSESQKDSNFDRYRMVSTNSRQNYGNPGMVLERAMELGEETKSNCTEITMSSAKYTTSEKWIMDHQKRKLREERNWAIKQRKTEERMTVCFSKLKEVVSSSDDISTKTKSVIELKKLQLLQLQWRLRSEFANDFFKPTTSDIERLKTFKKHKHGRRVKQLEKFEQKMKEERQKRIRERQKEFFSEIEVHKERLEDWFKIKRERWKGFNKYVKEFHKKKERIHREKIDRIQREKINLLKNNDVEGYLRMVQDAKSDRVKQLLKETEKYLQKLGSKVQESKALARQFEVEMDENRASPIVEKNEVTVEKEDDSDQAEHYLESNQKYYLMAHSIKESIAEQPASLQGGKLREYQMNGLRWLVSLYNNHLNGILADEMGLGKTVQVISLICYLMETKNDRGPFLVVVPSSVLSGWVSELSFWAPSIIKIAYAGPPEERRKLFKERIVQQKFNVLLTTYEYLMNKHDRPKLSRIQWHYVIIDEGHRIKNASCKLNADLKHYKSAHRLLLTGTPLQNNLEELWALLNFLLPSIFNSSDDFSQWFNKPFESGADTSPDDALLSEEENLLIINRLHQVLRPFVLRRLKHKVEHELPEKIERLVRCESSAYQKLLMKRVEDNLGCIGNSKGRSVHNSVMELRNICNHPYISQLHAEQVDSLVPRHHLPPIVRLCGKLEMLDRLLPKLKATDHRVLFFSTMTRLLDVMEEYLRWKRYRYLRLDGHTTGGDRGALIDEFNRPDSPAFIFLLSIRAGGVGVNLQAADTVIIFDTDWNPQVDLQAQARAHRIGQKKDVLVLRMETVHSVEEHVRAAAEHKLGVANQSITAGFFDNHTSAEDRREYLESLLRECKKEESASVLDDDALNDLLARSESEIETFELIDKQRREEETIAWHKLVQGSEKDDPTTCLPMPSRLVTDEDLKAFVEAMQAYEDANAGLKRKSEYTGGLDTQYYGRGKRAREVRSYEDQMTEDEFEKMCQVDPPDSPEFKDETKDMSMGNADATKVLVDVAELLPNPPPLQPQPAETLQPQSPLPVATSSPHSLRPIETPPSDLSVDIVAAPLQQLTTVTQPPPPKETPIPAVTPVPTAVAVLLSPLPLPIHPASSTVAVTPPSSQPPVQMTVQHPKQQPPRRGRGRPKRAATVAVSAVPSTVNTVDTGSQKASSLSPTAPPGFETLPGYDNVKGVAGTSSPEFGVGAVSASVTLGLVPSVPTQAKGHGRKAQSVTGTPRSRAKIETDVSPATLPEIIPSSATSKERGPASDAIMSAGVSDVPTVTYAVGSPLSRVQTGTPQSRAKKQTAVSPAILPEIIPSSATSKERGVASDAIMSAGASYVPTVTDAVGSPGPLSRVQTGTPRSRAKKQTAVSPATLPEIIPSSATSKERGVALDAIMSAGSSDVPTVTDAVGSPLSKVQTAVTMASDNSSPATISQDKQELVSAQSGTSAPTIVTYEVNPVTGLHTLVELVPVCLPIASPIQEKHKTPVPKRKKVERGRTSPVTKPVISETTMPDRKDKIESAEFEKDDGVKVSVTHGLQEPKIDQTATPVMSALAQDLMERRNLRMGPKNAKSGRKQKTTTKPGSSAAHIVKDAGAGLSTSVPKPEDVSGGPNSLNLKPLVVKPVPTQENVKPILGNITSIPELHSTARETISAQIEISSANPVESGAPQSSMSTANTPNVSSPVNQKPAVSVSSRQTRFSAAKEKARAAPAARRGPRKKDLARAAATAVNTSGPTTRGSLVGSLEMESSSKTAETDVTKGKVEIDTKSEQEPNTKEQFDCAVQSECQSASSTLHINASSSTMDGNSPCVQEAEQIDAQYKLKNEGVQCESRSGVVQVEPTLVKALTEGDSGMQVDTNKDVEASTTLTGKSTGICKEHHYQSVVPIVENVSKEPMDENRLDSLATDSATAPPENLVTSGQLSVEVFSIAEICSSTPKEPQQSVVLSDVDNVPEEPNSGDQVESVAVDATVLIRGDSSEDPMVQKADDSNNDSLASTHTEVPKYSSLQGVSSKNDILDEDATSSMDNNHAIHEEGLMNPENTNDTHISRERPDFIDLSLPSKKMSAHDNDQNTKLYSQKSEEPGVVTEDNETFVFSVIPTAATESCGPGELTPEVRDTTGDVHQSEEPCVISEDKAASVGVGYCDTENPIPRDQAASHDIQSFDQCVRTGNQETVSEVSTSAAAPESCNLEEPISQAQDPSCHDQIFKESCDVSGDKETHAMGVSTSFIAESCKSEELIPENRVEIAVPSLVDETDQNTKPCNQKPEEPGVRTEDKANHILGVTSESSDSVKPIPEIHDTACDVLQSEELPVMSKDKETAVFKVISSVGVKHSDLGESVTRDQDASHHSQTFGQCVTAGDTETVLEASTSATSAPESCNLEEPRVAQDTTAHDQKFKEFCDRPVLELNISVTEPCKSKDVIPEDQCEVQVPSLVEIGKASVLTDQNVKPYSHQSEEAGVRTTDKETLDFGRASAAASDSCDPANIIFAVQDTARNVVQSEEPFVTSEDKENLILKDQDASNFSQSFDQCIKTQDAEIVLEVSTSATGSPESCNLKESICVAQDPSHCDKEIEESCDRCGDKETPVVQFNTSSVAEPCKPEELVPEDLCEVDVSMSVECGKGTVDGNVVKEGRQFVKELSPQQVLGDPCEDLKTVETIELCAEKDAPMEDIVASVEADGNEVLERSVDSSSISSAPDPREVLKVTEVMDFPNVVEDTSMFDVSESQEVAGGNVESFTTSTSVESVELCAEKDAPMEDVVASVEADGNKVLERSVDSSSISAARDPREVLKVIKAIDFPNVVEDTSIIYVSESQEVAGGNVESFTTSASVEGISADISHDTRTSEIHQITNASMDVPESADVYEDALAENVNSSSTSVNVEVPNASMREVPGVPKAVDDTVENVIEDVKDVTNTPMEVVSENADDNEVSET